MRQTTSTAAALAHEHDGTAEGPAGYELGPTLVAADGRFETWRANTRIRVVCKDSDIQFVASSRGQARHLLDQSIAILTEMDARRARTSHLHPSWPR